MVLKTYYFCLLDPQNEQVVEEISLEEAKASLVRKLGYAGCGKGRVVVAHEVVFDSKGRQGCNHSV
jgi:hypothetical protein